MKPTTRLAVVTGHAHALAAAPGRGLDHDRVADPGGNARGLVGIELPDPGRDDERAAAAHGASRVHREVHDCLLELAGIDLHRCPVCHEGRMVVVAELDPVRRLSLHRARVAILDSS